MKAPRKVLCAPLLHGMQALALLATIVGFAGSANADVFYTSQSAFNAAAGPQTIITFDGIAASDSFVSYGAGPLALSGVTFTSNGSMFVIDGGYYGTAYPGGYLNSDYAASGTNEIVATLPSVQAVGFNFGGLFGAPVTFNITLSDGLTLSATSDSTSDISPDAMLPDFIGFTSLSALTSITIDMPDAVYYNAIDNFTFSATTVSSVPEPFTLSLFGAGLAGAVAMRRRKKAKA